MKRIALFFCAAAAAFLSGCGLFPMVTGSGIPVTTSFQVGSFSNIAAMQACRVRVVPDSVTMLEVTIDDNLVSYLDVRKTGADSVLIGLKQGYTYVGTTFTAEVHVPALTGLAMSGASEVEAAPGFSSALPLAVTLSGASRANLQGIVCGALSAEISGASSLTAAGSAGSETLLLSGASQARLLDCPTAVARVDLSGGSECWLQIGAGSIDLSASGGSTLYYRGAPAIGTINLSGGSRLMRVF